MAIMATHTEPLEISDTQADQLAAEALQELGETLLDEPDEYADQCDYAGCYPWLAEVIRSHPHDNALQGALLANGVADDDSFYTC
ncbi:MAG: hypothetical protein A2580_06580 [Hydrogenophilales bacterium RIFOXYD1_FULL_62_11]|nr:MAG: hypothetical protein A2580_06580 [Hydrogenophilales bacterium RIFOXYD1_FULL_62_11]